MKRTILALALLAAVSIASSPAGAQTASTFALNDDALSPGTLRSLAAMPVAARMRTPEPSFPLPQQGVLSVFQDYVFQYYGGYTFVGADGFPNGLRGRNGFDNSLAWYIKPRFGMEGALFTTFGWQYNERSRLVSAGGGPRVRWLTRSGRFQGWGHALVGASHYTPQLANGPQLAFSYQAGAGVDLMSPHGHAGFRVGGDIVASHFFGAWQYNPKLTVGIVIAFQPRP